MLLLGAPGCKARKEVLSDIIGAIQASSEQKMVTHRDFQKSLQFSKIVFCVQGYSVNSSETFNLLWGKEGIVRNPQSCECVWCRQNLCEQSDGVDNFWQIFQTFSFASFLWSWCITKRNVQKSIQVHKNCPMAVPESEFFNHVTRGLFVTHLLRQSVYME